VKKEEDPPENAIVYFYPPSASIEDRISICGQLIGMSHFMHGFVGVRPALCKLQTEKVATVHSGQYTLALGGNLSEPDSLLIRQLETLQSIFHFYHGSLERIRMMCGSHKIFLTWMNVIWDCYLHFVRHYGDFLPGVFDPLPFLDLPKRVAATCFSKASYILQACQRRQHILGGCILYSNSILCTQLEPSITERLLLLKPNQKNHPARPVKSACDLPFGVRILNAFLTLTEYQHLRDALAESAYRQPSSSHSSGTFPDLFATSSGIRDSSGRQIDESHLKSLRDPSPQVTSGNRSPQVTSDSRAIDSREYLESIGREGNSKENLVRVVASGAPVGTGEDAVIREEIKHIDGNSGMADGKDSKSQSQCKTESLTSFSVDPSFVEHTLSDKRDVGGDTTTAEGEGKTKSENDNSERKSCVFAGNKDEENDTDKNENSRTDQTEGTNSTAVFDSSSCDSGLSNDVSLTMEAIDVAGLKILEYSSSQCQGQQCGEAKVKCKPGIWRTGAMSNESNYTTSDSAGNGETNICSLVLEDLIRKVVEEVDKENFDLKSESSESVVGHATCCEVCTNAQKSCYRSGGRDEPCESKENACHAQGNKSLSNRDHRSIEHDLKKENVNFSRDIRGTDLRHSNGKETSFKSLTNAADFANDTNPNSENGLINDMIRTGKHATDPLKSDRSNGEETSCRESPRPADFAENCLPIDANPDKKSSRSDLIKTPIVCDSFSIRNLNVQSEKLLEKSFACMDAFADAEIPECEANVSTPPSNPNGSTRTLDATASFISAKSDSEIFVANGQEGIASSGGLEAPVDQALEEVEEQEEEEEEEEEESWEWFEPPLGDIHSSSLAEVEGEEELLFEEEGGGESVNQVESLTHVNLYVQAHSNVVLILLTEEGLHSDCNSIKALWETSLNQLGELEFLVKQSLGDEPIPAYSDEYSFLVYDSFERNMTQGNLDELVYQVDHSFCETTKVLHEQFENCSTLKDVTIRSRSSTVYGKQNLGRGTYFHLKGSPKTLQGVPSPRDPILKLERRATKVLHKEHGINVF